MAQQPPRIDDLRRRVLQDPASIAFAQLAEEYRRVGAFESAVEVCRVGLAKHPGYLSARVTLGLALLELGQVDAAHDELQAVLAGSPDNQAALRGLGAVFHRRGSLKEALAHYRRALGLSRHDPDLQQLVAELTRQAAATSSRRPAAAAPAAPKAELDGLLSLEQLTQELQLTLPQPPAPRPTGSTAGPTSGTVPTLQTPESRPASDSEAAPRKADDLAVLAKLEGWLTAIHGFRAERRASTTTR